MLRIKWEIMMMMPIVNVVIVPVWASPLTTYQVAAKGIFQVNALHTNVHCAPLLHSTLIGVMLNTELLFFYHILPSCSHNKMWWTRFWFDVLISHWLRSDHLKAKPVDLFTWVSNFEQSLLIKPHIRWSQGTISNHLILHWQRSDKMKA